MTKLVSINPSTYQPVGEIDITTEAEIQKIVAAAHSAKNSWREIGLEERIKLLQQVFTEMQNQKDELGLLASQEMGMPINDSIQDVIDSSHYTEWYLENAEKYLSPETTHETDTEIHQVYYEPLGVVAAIIPWNFPVSNVIWATSQALLAGNVVIVKRSEECPLVGERIASIYTKYLPSGVYSEIYGAGETGAQLVTQEINMLTFTGSTGTGKKLYEIAGKKYIKAVVELGGSAPGIIFEDADIAATVENVTFLRLLNSGQVCDGLKRLIVNESKFDEVIQKLKTAFEAKKVGPAEATTTEMGPLVAQRQLELLESQVKDAIDKGATVVTGGKNLQTELGGAFYAPTILTNIKPEMRVWHEEVFGPVLPVVSFKTDEEAVQLANDTEYGLGGYIYTSDLNRADKIAAALQTGMISVNSTNYVMPMNPFGGYKSSGMGREHGKFGFAEVTQIKVVTRNK